VLDEDDPHHERHDDFAPVGFDAAHHSAADSCARSNVLVGVGVRALEPERTFATGGAR
jgi:hypothetical protein